ncbi:hypothetical protein D3C71_2040610 [compost metagenome]
MGFKSLASKEVKKSVALTVGAAFAISIGEMGMLPISKEIVEAIVNKTLNRRLFMYTTLQWRNISL